VKTLLYIPAILAALFIIGPAPAMAEGWGMPKLNPFAKQKNARATASVSDAPVSGWKWPKLWPSKAAGMQPRTSRPAAPSTWQKMTAGTKSAMSKTADALNPFDDANDNQPRPGITGSNTVFSQASKNKESKGRSFLPSWPWGKEESSKPKDVNSFLSQPRPDF
jgi:hypothetical protein